MLQHYIIGNGVGDNRVEKINQKTFKSKALFKSKKTQRSPDSLTPKAKPAFIKLRHVFVKTPVLYHFNSKRYIRIETNILGSAIGGILNQLSLNNLS